MVGTDHLQYCLAEKGRIHTRLKDGAVELLLKFRKILHHKFIGAIGVVNITRAVKNIKELTGLWHSAK